jgi:8-oxo-dGTP pyrophosphatase MutT (NUDIX family)
MPHLLSPISVHAIIVNERGEVLLLQNIRTSADTKEKTVEEAYTFPGGHIEEAEADPIAALSREIREETGLTRVRILLPVHTSIWGRTHRRFSVIYLARTAAEEPVVLQKEEAASYRWETFSAAQKLPLINGELLTALEKAERLWNFRPHIKSATIWE